jgi:uncharacterized membrane protein YfcA
MSESTANRLVMFFLFGGIAFALVRKKNTDAQTTYRRIWGTTLLSIAGAALAGFVPTIVGPFFLLVIIAYATGNIKILGNSVKGLQSKATGAKQ